MYLSEEEAMCGKKSIYRERDGDRTVLFFVCSVFHSSRDWPVKTLVSKRNIFVL
ncbi:hypothetical protein ISN44_As04g032580 [Arabidopsis suecica]|uniref:Uncharacterized protein n=1 Tax=Arabidopsis suecica TaxID=45249 RepID=A0A8T2EEM9_ARASU|nr:hypothetical protein ISN44_As04g032580 [Arabidopsis suecica]